jgi:hypothetical protein
MSSDSSNVTVEENVPATMRDGTVLRADVYRPAGDGPWPVLLARTPFGKHVRSNITDYAYEMAGRGYLVVLQDVRGRYASDGEFWDQLDIRSLPIEAEDGYDTVEWAARLPDADGRVGTWGNSYLGFTGWRAAAGGPPSLTALFTSGNSGHSRGSGIFQPSWQMMLDWIVVDLRRHAEDPTGPQTTEEADQLWELNRQKWLWFLPYDELPEHVFGPFTSQFKERLRTVTQERWPVPTQGLQIPSCQLTGWWDGGTCPGTLWNYNDLVRNSPAEVARQHRVVVGPWPHDYWRLKRNLGLIDYGPEADTTYPAEILRWYDWRFKGIDNGLADEAPLKLFVLNEGWRYEDQWPPAGVQETDFFLESDGSANTPSGDGRLSRRRPEESQPDRYVYDPRDPVMSLPDSEDAGPSDQAILRWRRDILVYQTEPLEEDLVVLGEPVVTLWAASDGPDTDFTAKLIEVRPDGLAINVNDPSIIRARYRFGLDQEVFLTPGEPAELTLRLNPVGVRFQKGSRIRLDISSSDFPNYDRNHNTGKPYWSDSELRIARQTVYHDREHPSRLTLPVVPQ